MTEPADYKYYKNVQTAQELILRTGNKKFNDITILLEHTEKAGSIPKSNPHLLHAELKNRIPRHDNITHMYFTRSGKRKISTSDPVCAVQITAIDQILNTPVKANIIWEGFTSRFLLFDIPTNVHLADVAIELKNSNDLDIVEIRRFVKPNSRQEASPVLITILGINTPECVKLWFCNHKYNYS
ncbi:putative RNA-directed DNA polymerase from transposon X-element [Trichonephila clavipes]|nr:putative RNA-directed DNA polymerase from transposon X-element [Trichonephila clavipes]